MMASFSGAVELGSSFAPRPQITHVVFDFDGTLSWLRHGWPEIMFDVLRQHFTLKPVESEEALHDLLLNDILSLNGKPSIHQMIRGTERMKERGGAVPDPQKLLLEYDNRLDAAIGKRTERILSGQSAPDEFIVFGARNLL